ncbi:glycosyltransferase family 4 protein [Actinacidiphila oryziradicis]|uniref:D-inositol 3-phosphate glycosyltransferase n=1 Tax=Actinacidiphila oryziradicis TaxID=2571141 RepID=A0A4U0SUR3_9ACTN|nr:glycosyltransferase family 4 protein [Actinacidiphila oryziradicis]
MVQPYIPQYRVPFFQRLAGDLHDHGVLLTVAHGRPTGSQARRGDIGALPGAVPLPQHAFRLGGRTMLWRRLGDLAHHCDAVVLEQALHNLEAYPLLASARLRGGPAVCLWGHGRTYGDRPTAAERALKDALTRRADWFFAYTDAGARHVVRGGLPAERVTVVRNSVDTASIAAALARITPGQVLAFRARYGLTAGRTALFLGGLDAPKRIPFLIAAAELTARRLPGFRLLVAGDGAHRGLVEQAAARPGSPVIRLGPVTDAEGKALLGAAGDVLLMPGAVGLAAVDSLALSTPMITTPCAAHGPEFDYLQHDRNALIVPGGEAEFADEVVSLLADPGRLSALRRAAREDARHYSGEVMSARFTGGLLRLIGTGN